MKPPFEDIPAWPPARYTGPLTEDFTSALDPLLPVLKIAWREAFGYDLEHWQIALLRAILEVFPEGHKRAGQLRFRQVIISLGRQNGKTEIAAALGLWQLLRKAGALVIGIASSAEQARLVYDRAMKVISRNPALAKRFDALTDTRGIRAKDGGKYEIKAAKSAALQGLPIDLGIVDEVHLLKSALWNDLINGTGGRPDCLVVGITTAGDPDSELLIDLYALAETAIPDEATRIGVFIWEAPEATVPDDDETLGRYLAAANPSIASGRVDPETVISDVRAMPKTDAIRYRLNRFLTSSEASFLALDEWLSRTRREDEMFPGGRVVFTFDRTPEWSWATVTATVKDGDGNLWTEVVASVPHPTVESLVALAEKLWVHSPIYFAADQYALKQFLAELKRRGYPTWDGSQSDAIASASLLYSAVMHDRLFHAGDELLARQVPMTKRKNVGESFRISRTSSSVEIDAVLATALGIYVADSMPDIPLQVF